ncbi:MAG: hypothetical protein BA869_10800 [Desulfuromonadales bacterium C00003107]|nr:MAG: hypothetical protein BA869_10800 [Desulfuromonadales bacterium C00003107]
MIIEFNRLGFVRVMAVCAVERVSAVHQSVTVAARGQVAVLDVAVIAFERRVHAPTLFNTLVLRNVAGAAPATVQVGIVDPLHGRMRIRVAACAAVYGCAMGLRVAVPAVRQIPVLYVAEGAVQRCMHSTSVRKRVALRCVAVHTFCVL